MRTACLILTNETSDTFKNELKSAFKNKKVSIYNICMKILEMLKSEFIKIS